MEQPDDHAANAAFESVGGAVCLDFVNTGSARREGPFKERLNSYADVLAWAVSAGQVTAAEREELMRLAKQNGAAASQVLERGRALREAVYRVFSGLSQGEPPDGADLELLSREHAAVAAHRQLIATPDGVQFGWQSEPLHLDRPLWPVAQSAADLLVSAERARVKECGTDNCNWLFLDASKNKSRRWCEMRECGNREKARRHYAKRKGGV
jgi:predicted RNA-binding Zn ribbon-like protein